MQRIVPASPGTRRTPTASVILDASESSDGLSRTLESVSSQTLPGGRFEVLLVVTDATGEVDPALATFREEHPDRVVRVVRSTRPGAAAKNSALWAARGEFVTFVRAGDHLSSDYLTRLLNARRIPAPPGSEREDEETPDTRLGVVPLARLAGPDGTIASRAPARRGRGPSPALVHPLDLPADAMSDLAGALLPTGAARETGFDERLETDVDLVFMTRLYARSPFRFRLLRQHAAYHRGDAVVADPLGADRESQVGRSLDVVAVLDEIETESTDVERVTVRAVERQYHRLNAFIRAHPEQRESIVDEIDRRGLRRVRWSSLNHGMARHLGLLYTFTPWNTTSGLVAARRIRERGIVTDVICQDLDSVRERDESSRQIAEPFIDSIHVVPGRGHYREWWAVRAYSHGVFEALPALEATKKYERVYSRVGWAASHFVAAQYKARNPQVEWLAEFSDPLFRTMEGEPRPELMDDDEIVAELRTAITEAGFTPPEGLRLFEWVEYVAYALADEILFTNENQRRFMVDSIEDPELAARVARVATVARHPTLPPPFYAMKPHEYALDPERVHLGYFGVFYPRRGLTEVTGALAALSALDRERVQLHVFTVQHKKVRAEVAEAGLGDVITVNPYLPFLEFLNVTQHFDALLVNDANTEGKKINPYLPSKLSDYLGSGSAIWAISEPGSVLSTLDLPFRTHLGDVPAAVATIQKIIASTQELRSVGGAGALTVVPASLS